MNATASSTERQGERDALARELTSHGITDAAVLEAIRRVPRHRFVPASMAAHAYEDRALPLGEGQTISQPYIVAYMTQCLGIERGDRILEVGTGSGYQAAVLAELADEVYSIEIIPALAEAAASVLAELGCEGVRLRVGDGQAGWPEHAPFDGIVVTAAASELPERLVEQLAPGGRLVIPLDEADGCAQWIWLVTKDADGRVERERTIPVRFVPMTGGGASSFD